ncbi:MAG: DNA primase [Prevotella sp.]|nr:DNA primase [Prevotella sp.]
MIDRLTVDKIMDAANIVDVVGEFVNLRKAGVNYKGLCPFHDDKTPSFMVSPAKNICHCFACGKGGTPVSFLMEHEQITYPEALRWLAKKYNIEIEERELSDEERREQCERESMFIVNEWAKDYFHDILNNDIDGQAIGKQYFRSRGIRDDIMRKFALGYSPAKRDAMSTAAIAKGYKPEFLLKTGLCYERNQVDKLSDVEANNSSTRQLVNSSTPSTLIDRYAGRVIFPWFNVSGKVVAFGGRLLDSRTKGVQQKYVNSPDSDIYHKERELYGLYQAKKAIVKEDCVYMVEGYTDVIAMHQCGVENVVANSGTALSIHQVHILHRFTNNIVLLYDGDEAGIKAAMRGTDMLLSEGMNVKVLLLPDGDDPDSFSRKHSAEELKRYIEEHQTDFIQFKTDLLLKGVTDPIKRSEAIGSIVRSVSVIPNQIIRDTYLRECSHRLHMNEQTLINTMNNYIRSDKEQEAKDKAREQREEAQANVQEGAIPHPSSLTPHSSLLTPHSSSLISQPSSMEVERMLVQCIVRYGERVIIEGVETEDGQVINLSVSQYIDYDLSQDGLVFSNELYNQILAEAVEHNCDEGFVAETYFTSHPDVRISQLAATLAINHYQLSKSLQMEMKQDTLRQQVNHLILDFRMDIVEGRLKEIQLQLRQVGNDMDRIRQLLQEQKDVQQLRDTMARQLGNDVIVK